ncbi:E3 ubiquitin-protein ligase RNF170-like isoform X2 [Dendrobium catenatum]|uniref:E3 ubiquitin-protein ligase RNF170-like isoform X2 n=1 Tax=Dendrobium catenatum TaxID=906689 RepID=UPI0009F30AC8|nr:E3 ubiquitin-protein ligase RNF170-like isoform X2 [Dendrobium catenatum]
MDSPPENDVCSVCHERFTLPCQANCSHWFCGSCIMRVWHHGSALRPCKCPICRRLITLLIPTETSQSQRHEPAASQILENIEKYNRSFGGGSHSIMQIVPTILYVLSPIDILPEGVFGLVGFIDDLLILLIAFLHLAALYRSILLYRHGGQ